MNGALPSKASDIVRRLGDGSQYGRGAKLHATPSRSTEAIAVAAMTWLDDFISAIYTICSQAGCEQTN